MHITPNNNVSSRILRFEFSGVLVDHVTAFANLHRYDDRKTYKEAWTAWLAHDEIAALIKAEAGRLSALGYKGDVADKLFKSGRYYFRGKETKDKETKDKETKCKETKDKETKDKETKDKANRKYVLLNRQLLDTMDVHIECGLRSTNAYTPAGGFAEFCKLNAQSDPFCSEVTRLSELMPTGEAVHNKLKKTYKNRYFIMTKSGKT